MKLNYTSFFTAAILMVGATNANAEILFDFYAGGTVGLGNMTMFSSEDHDDWSAQSYGLVAGIDFPVIRIEAEYDVLSSHKIDMQTVMGNAYVKLPGTVINPYLGFGVGAMVHASHDYDIDIDTTVAYQGMLGVTFNIPTLPIKIDLEGRVMYMSDLYEYYDDDVDAIHYDVRAKLRVLF